jgi:hypothetical protein
MEKVGRIEKWEIENICVWYREWKSGKMNNHLLLCPYYVKV